MAETLQGTFNITTIVNECEVTVWKFHDSSITQILREIKGKGKGRFY